MDGSIIKNGFEFIGNKEDQTDLYDSLSFKGIPTGQTTAEFSGSWTIENRVFNKFKVEFSIYVENYSSKWIYMNYFKYQYIADDGYTIRNSSWTNQGRTYDDYYLGQTYKFVKKLIDYSIPEKSKLNNATITLKTISKKEFRKLACEYMDEIFKNVNSKEYLVFDQFLTISNPDDELFSDYFKSYKQIFVWSDPRDMYIRGLAHDCQWWLPEDPELFVKFFKRNSEKYFNSNNPNLLIICFDELIHNYEETLVKIMKFLNLTEHEHVKKFEYFNPERSIKNTGLWKNFKNQDAINYIYNNLKDYCWDN